MSRIKIADILLAAACFLSGNLPSYAQGTAFTYLGALNDAGHPATGTYDLTFALYSTSTGSGALGTTITNLGVSIADGRFAITLDFGPGAFPGADRWLEISVRTNNAATPFVALAPRQPITPAPYAITAVALTGPISSANLVGAYLNPIAFNNPSNTYHGQFTGDGSALQNLNAANLTSGLVPLARLSGINSNQLDPATDAAYRSLPTQTNVISVFNVKDYGAKGDGSDDSVAIAAALYALTNSPYGGTLYFPAGNYRDTNTYTIFPGRSYDGTLFGQYTFQGDSRGTSHWLAAINNATFISGYLATVTMKDITIANVGTGTNNGFKILTSSGPMNWYGVQFSGWNGVGVNVQNIAGGCLYGCVFEYCAIGLRVPGYSDGWTGDLRIDHCSRAGVDIGGYSPFYQHRGAAGGRWHVVGANNNIVVIVGDSAGQVISGYIENASNCIVALGHPPEFNDNDTTVKSVVIENMSYLLNNTPGYTEVLSRIYAPTEWITLRNIGGASTNVVSTSPAFDRTPVTVEGVQSTTIMLFSDGTTVPGVYPPAYTTINVPEQHFNGSHRYYYNTTDGAITLGGPVGSGIQSGIGSPLNVITAPVGSIYLRTDGGAGATFYVKETGAGATGWVAK